MKKISLDADRTLVTKTDSQGITDLNVQYETIELLEDMEGANLETWGVSTTFQVGHQRHDPQKKELVDFIKIKDFCTSKNIIKKGERTTHKMRENIC